MYSTLEAQWLNRSLRFNGGDETIDTNSTVPITDDFGSTDALHDVPSSFRHETLASETLLLTI